MFISSLLIDIGDNPDQPRPGRLWLRNRYHVHQRLCMAFPSDPRKERDPEFLSSYDPCDFPEQRHLACECKEVVGDPEILAQVHARRNKDTGFLFRIDPLPNGRVVILVQSAVEPDWEYAFHNAGHFLAALPETKTFEPRFAKGQRLRFRLVANPTKKIDTKSGYDGQRRNGKRVPVPTDQLCGWLIRRAEKAGFFIEDRATTVQPGYVYVNKTRDGKGQRLRSVRYDGVLEVTDPAKFKDTIIRGIGSGKAFGFGLLSVAPVHSSHGAEAK